MSTSNNDLAPITNFTPPSEVSSTEQSAAAGMASSSDEPEVAALTTDVASAVLEACAGNVSTSSDHATSSNSISEIGDSAADSQRLSVADREAAVEAREVALRAEEAALRAHEASLLACEAEVEARVTARSVLNLGLAPSVLSLVLQQPSVTVYQLFSTAKSRSPEPKLKAASTLNVMPFASLSSTRMAGLQFCSPEKVSTTNSQVAVSRAGRLTSKLAPERLLRKSVSASRWASAAMQ